MNKVLLATVTGGILLHTALAHAADASRYNSRAALIGSPAATVHRVVTPTPTDGSSDSSKMAMIKHRAEITIGVLPATPTARRSASAPGAVSVESLNTKKALLRQ